MPRNRWIGLNAVRNDDWRLLLLLQLLQVRILSETRNLVVGGSGRRWRDQRRGHHFFRKRMESRMKRVVHRTSSVAASASAAVAPTNRSELDQRAAHLLLVILLPNLLVDQRQGCNNSAVHGSHEIRVVVVGLLHHHHGDVVHSNSGRLLAIRQEVSRHLPFAFNFDSPAALKLVRLMPQHLIHFLRYLFNGIYK